jgi:hypothetical protein
VIPVDPVPEPSGFDARARKPGKAWLTENPGAARPRDYWSPFREALAEGFKHRCGYSAMREPSGTVDHFRSYKADPALTYEWTNYRYASQWINSSKKAGDALDPYEVGEGWFEVLLPSLELVVTEKIPPALRERAERMLQRLPIGRDRRIIKQRQAWYAMYKQKKLSLEGLHEVAPLLAAAEEKRLAANRTEGLI